MFYSENLLSKEGPLAQVWLAANLERKLSKNQFLQSNIIQSTKAIANASSQNDESEALALRLSGQLLYGVVRIYSRKAKYLLDDVSDALLKLKSAFKSSANTVTLPANATIVPSVNQLILQDTITQSDLLYQEPLNLDDNENSNPRNSDFFGHSQAITNQDFDDSIEIPRNKFDELDDLEPGQDDLDIDLNFELNDDNRVEDQQEYEKNDDVDLGDDFDFDFSGDKNNQADESIEVGRDANDDPNLSTLEPNNDFDLGFDLGDEINEPNEKLPESQELIDDNEQPKTPTKKQTKRKAKSTNLAGYKKIVEDSTIELPIKNFSNTEGIVANDDEQTHELDLNAKRSYLDLLLNNNYIQSDIAENLLRSKRQKVNSPPADDEVPELEHSEEENATANKSSDNLDFDFDQGIDFDFDLHDDKQADDEALAPIEENEEELLEAQRQAEQEEQDSTDDFNSGSKDGISEATIKISSQLREQLSDDQTTSFSDIVKTNVDQGEPLSKLPKSEATRVFFELLVLGTSDSIELKQKELFGEIQVDSRPNLFQKFL